MPGIKNTERALSFTTDRVLYREVATADGAFNPAAPLDVPVIDLRRSVLANNMMIVFVDVAATKTCTFQVWAKTEDKWFFCVEKTVTVGRPEAHVLKDLPAAELVIAVTVASAAVTLYEEHTV